jgi:hypothetical protein
VLDQPYEVNLPQGILMKHFDNLNTSLTLLASLCSLVPKEKGGQAVATKVSTAGVLL